MYNLFAFKVACCLLIGSLMTVSRVVEAGCASNGNANVNNVAVKFDNGTVNCVNSNSLCGTVTLSGSGCSGTISGCTETTSCPATTTLYGCTATYSCGGSSATCFSSDMQVETSNRGTLFVGELRTGDLVKAYDSETGQVIFSPFVTYAHADSDMYANFIEIATTSSSNTLKLTPTHMIMKRSNNGGDEFVHASELKVNDILVVEESNGVTKDVTIVSITADVYQHGVYSPLTEQGTLLVNGIVASSYSGYSSHHVAHMVHPHVVRLAEFLNTFVGFKDTTEMALKLGVFAMLAQMPGVSRFVSF